MGARFAVARTMVGDHHVRVSDLIQGLHVLIHAHHALIRPDFLELIRAADDVTEVAEENLVLRPELTDDGWHIIRRIRRRLRHAAQTQIQAVIVALTDGDELSKAVRPTHDTIDATETGRQPRITGVAGHAHLAFFCDGDDTLEVIRDALPVHLGGDGFIVAL